MNYLHNFLFGIFPYIALGVFIIGCWLRYDHGQFTWRAGSSQMLSKKNVRMASIMFHVGIIIVFFGHLVGLLTPHWVYEPFMTPGTKQVMAIVVGGIAGAFCLVGASMLFYRRIMDPRVRASSTVGDTMIIGILAVQVLLGLLTILPTLGHLDGATMLLFSSWAQGIFTFDPNAASYIVDVHWIYKTHIALGLAVFLIFPFTRLVHMFSVPLEYATRNAQVVRKRA